MAETKTSSADKPPKLFLGIPLSHWLLLALAVVASAKRIGVWLSIVLFLCSYVHLLCSYLLETSSPALSRLQRLRLLGLDGSRWVMQLSAAAICVLVSSWWRGAVVLAIAWFSNLTLPRLKEHPPDWMKPWLSRKTLALTRFGWLTVLLHTLYVYAFGGWFWTLILGPLLWLRILGETRAQEKQAAEAAAAAARPAPWRVPPPAPRRVPPPPPSPTSQPAMAPQTVRIRLATDSPALVELVPQDEPTLRLHSDWQTCNNMREHLRAAALAPSSSVRIQAVRGLAAIAEPCDIECVLRLAESDPVRDVRLAALESLGALPPNHEQLVALLNKLITDGDLVVRWQAQKHCRQQLRREHTKARPIPAAPVPPPLVQILN